MKALVRTKPIPIYYVTGYEAGACRYGAYATYSDKPGFVTESFGSDGFVWDTAEEFEQDYEASFSKL